MGHNNGQKKPFGTFYVSVRGVHLPGPTCCRCATQKICTHTIGRKVVSEPSFHKTHASYYHSPGLRRAKLNACRTHRAGCLCGKLRCQVCYSCVRAYQPRTRCTSAPNSPRGTSTSRYNARKLRLKTVFQLQERLPCNQTQKSTTTATPRTHKKENGYWVVLRRSFDSCDIQHETIIHHTPHTPTITLVQSYQGSWETCSDCSFG